MRRTRRQLRLISRPWTFWLLEKAAPLAGYRRLKRHIPWFAEEGLNVSCLPINEDIALGEDVVMPVQLLEEFIEEASHRVIVDFCACRVSQQCRRYPADIGCLMMGDAALQIHPSVRREVSPGEAIAHVHRAVDAGLVPFVGRARIDNLVFGIRHQKRMLSTCFCCECCCISRFARHVPSESRNENVIKLDGLRVEVTDACDGCGACASRCFLGEITIVDGRAVIGDGCAGCGRCATVCTRDAIKLSLDNPGFIDEARERISALVDLK